MKIINKYFNNSNETLPTYHTIKKATVYTIWSEDAGNINF